MEPKIAFQGHFWNPQDLSNNPMAAIVCLMETSWASIAYGYGAAKKLKVYADNGDALIPVDKLYADAVELSLGIFTIDLHKHDQCTRLICNCKTM